MAEQIQIVVSETGSRTVKRNISDIGNASKRSHSMVSLLKRGLLGFSLGAGFLAAGRELFAFNDALAEASTLVDTTSFNMKKLRQDALDNAKAFGSFPSEQVKAQYQIISAGASDAASAQEILAQSNKLAVGGATDLTTAADGLTSVLNAYGDKVESAEAVSDAMFVGMRAGKTTIGELSGSLGKVAPLAAAAGVGFDELVASTAALTKGGISTRESVTGVRAILAAVVKPTQEAKEMAASLGIEFNAAALESKGLAGFLKEVADKTGGSSDQIAQLFGGVEALVPMMALAGDAGEDFNQILEDMGTKAGATEEAFDKMANSPGFQSARIWAGLKAKAIELGDGFLQRLVPAMKFIADNLDGIVAALGTATLGFGLYRLSVLAVTFAKTALGKQLLLTGAMILSTAGQFGIAAAAQATFAGVTAGATVIVRGLTAAMAANPIGAIIVAITAAVALFQIFGDAIKVTKDGTVSLKDAFVAAGQLIVESISSATEFLQAAWTAASEVVNGIFESFGASFSGIMSFIGTVAKTIINAVIGFWVLAFNTIKAAWNNFPGFMDAIFTNVLNIAARAAELVLNAWQAPLRAISAGMNAIGDGDGGLGALLDGLSISVPRAQLNSAGKAFASEFGKGFESAQQDFLGDFGTAVMARARSNNAAEAAAKSQLGDSDVTDAAATAAAGGDALGAGKDGAGANGGRNLRTRADLLKRINEETDNSIDLARSMNFEWEKVDEDIVGINEKLARQFGENAVLTEAETVVMRDKLKTMYDLQEVQDLMREAYDQFSQPQKDYEQGQKAINAVMREFPEYARDGQRALRDLRIEFLLTKTDMASGLEAGKLQVANDVENGGATRAAQAYREEWGKVNGALQEAEASQAALQRLMVDDPINAGTYANELRLVKYEIDEIKLAMGDATFGDAMRIGLQRFVADFKGVIPGLKNAWANFFTSFADGVANSIGQAITGAQSFGDALRDVAQSAISELISSLVRLGIQWLVMQIIGQTAQTAMAATGIAAGTATAAAWAPAAAAVSLATFGANAGPAMAGIATTFALTKALSSIPGFADGGYINGVGGPRDDKNLAWLSDGEFVVNAGATAKHLGLLQAINDNSRVPGFSTGGKMGKGSRASSALLRSPVNDTGSSQVSEGDTYISIDARGADAGVEERLNRILDERSDEIVTKARKKSAQDRRDEDRRQVIGGQR